MYTHLKMPITAPETWGLERKLDYDKDAKQDTKGQWLMEIMD